MRRCLPACAALAALALCAASAQAAPTITETAAGNGPLMTVLGPDSNVWFTDEPNPGRVGRITTSGATTLFDAAHDGKPTDITAGPGGLWFTNANKDKISRIATNGTITDFNDGAHNQPTGITAGPDGNLWYTAVGNHGAIARITPTGTVTEFTTGLTTDGSPQDIVAGPDGNLWFTAPGSGRIGRITPGGVITQYGAGTLISTPRYITVGPDGALWFTMSGMMGAIGRISTSGAITQYPIGATNVPQGITTGADGNIYFTDSFANAIGKITPSGTITSSTGVLTPAAGLRGITTGSDGRLWFAEQSASKIGQMTVAPTAGPVSESAVTDATATLASTVTPNSQATTYSFEYGTTTSYGSTTSSTSVGSGPTAVPVTASITGLSPSTTYHARVVAINATGTTTGPDHTFTTTAPGAPVATTLAATGVTTSAATLNATVNPNNAPTTYHFEVGTSAGSYDSDVPASDAVVGSDATDHAISESLAGLAPNTTYHFRVVATSASGITHGDDQAFTMAPHAPSVASTAATAVTTDGATLNAAINPRNAATTYHFEYGTAPGTYTDQVPVTDAAVGSDATGHAVSDVLTALAPSTSYYFRAVATSTAGATNGPEGSFTTAAAPLTAPPPTTTTPLPGPAAPTAATPDPRPVLGRTAVAAVSSGSVRFRPPGGSAYRTLGDHTVIPSGATLDAQRGTIVLESAIDARGHSQSASFRGAIFRVDLSRTTKGLVDIRMTQKPTGCPARKATARAAAKKRPPLLWAKDSKGRYRTHGRNSVATVRGTEWTTSESCSGTVTRVVKGAVSVLDLRTKRSRLVRAGHSYLARNAR